MYVSTVCQVDSSERGMHSLKGVFLRVELICFMVYEAIFLYLFLHVHHRHALINVKDVSLYLFCLEAIDVDK